jgi:methylenetetrahydrofolate reductase (NADPH)
MISDVLSERKDDENQVISFEYFPPRTEQGVTNLVSRLERMKALGPAFIDFTWGAGGRTSDLTMDLCKQAKDMGFVTNMHLTCTNMEVEKLYKALEEAKEYGIRNLVALRGDPPQGEERWEAVEGGFTCALDLVEYIRREHGDYFHIAVAGYPEGHPDKILLESRSFDELSDAEKRRCSWHVNEEGERQLYVCNDEDFGKEMEYLKAKVDAGSDMIITQMFFDTEVFGDFVTTCRAYGIEVPIVPGIMCINNKGGFQRMTAFCRSRVPQALRERIEACEDDDAAKLAGIEEGTRMCQELIALSAPVLHFYTLNLEKVTVGILENLGLVANAAGLA